MSTGFAGRVVVVTGGASGVGRACVELLMSEGASVASIDLATTASDLGQPTFELVGDVRDQASMDTAMTAVAEEFGGIDVLVNNAGISFVGGVEDGDEEEWRRVFDVNLMGYVRSTRAALPHLRRSESPSIVNVSSTTATSGFRRRSLYSATKGAIEALTRSMAADLVSEGITVNAVNPGTVDTPFMTELAERTENPAATRAAFEARQPTGRMVHPREVGRAVAYCAHPDNRSLVGSTIVVDGGILGLHITEA